jgi:hypothetical protein
MERVVNWIASSWVDIQAAHPDWQWLRKSFSFTTVENKATYTPVECGIADFGSWSPETFRSYPTAVGTKGERYLYPIGYESYRNQYLFGAYRDSAGVPTEVAIHPDLSLCIGQKPDSQGYTITGDYYAQPVLLVDNTDVPAISEQHHMAIVYRAMMHYGAYSSAPEVFQRGDAEYRKMLRRMQADRMRPITVAGALA